MNWKERLKEAREADEDFKNKSVFAKAVGVSGASITDWEKSVDAGGIKQIKALNALKACEILKMTQEWLFNGEGDPPLKVQEARKKSASKATNEEASNKNTSQKQIAPKEKTKSEVRQEPVLYDTKLKEIKPDELVRLPADFVFLYQKEIDLLRKFRNASELQQFGILNAVDLALGINESGMGGNER